MKKGLTELVFILDRSGSMAGLESDTVGGYNALLQKQKNEDGECVVTTVLFDDRYELLHDRINLRSVAPITGADYYVRGNTALYDALGRTIGKIDRAQSRTAEAERAEKVLFVITTDGMENASREYGERRVRAMIRRQTECFGWEFLFLGANIDAAETAGRFGIAPDRAADYHADSAGTQLNFAVVSDAVSNLRSKGVIDHGWKEKIDEDFKNRGGR